MDAAPARDDIRARTRRLTDYLATHDIAAAIVARPEHVRYLTGWSGTMPGGLVLSPSGGLLVVPEGSGGTTAAAIAGTDLSEYLAYSPSQLIDAESVGAQQIRNAVRALAPAGRRHRLATDVSAYDPESSSIDLTPVLRAWRRVKDVSEIEAIRDRVAGLDSAFAATRDAIRPGLTELHLQAVIHEQLQASTAESLRLDANLGSGPLSAMSDPHATTRKLEDGDLVLVDLYPRLEGYVADLTRTFVVGHPTAEQTERWAIVREALSAAERLLGPRTDVREIDAAVRSVLARAGAGELPHHVGHGIGIDGWEAPWIGSAADGRLEVGNVVAIEPGLYVQGWGGMRLEANYVIRAEGAERLDRFPESLTGG